MSIQVFAHLIDKLYFTSSNLAKSALIREYLSATPDPDRGWAIAAIAGTLNFDFFKRKLIKDLIVERVDPLLFELSYDYVGEMSETVAHLWSAQDDDPAPLNALPTLDDVVQTFANGNRAQNRAYLISLLNSMNASERWALLKLGTRGLRIGVSARFLKKVLAEYGKKHNPNLHTEDIERLWHGLTPPYTSLLLWLDGKAEIPDVSNSVTFQPVMLSHPIDKNDIHKMHPDDWQAEWKFDGIRVQLVVSQAGKALFSRTGDDISGSFPEILAPLDTKDIHGVFDGELVALRSTASVHKDKHKEKHLKEQGDGPTKSEIAVPTINGVLEAKHRAQPLTQHSRQQSTQCSRQPDSQYKPQQWHIASFNELQQRLNKKKPSKKLIEQYPAGIILYDVLIMQTYKQTDEQTSTGKDTQKQDLREQPLSKRCEYLHTWFHTQPYSHLHLAIPLQFDTPEDLAQLRDRAATLEQGYIEGIMLKAKSSLYHAGRPKGLWYKWKRNPFVIDAVMMYAQRGHGKRSSFYSDYTFGCWQNDALLPVGKAYSGFTDEELKKLDNWVRKNTIGRFGPVKEVNKALVCELAFDSVHDSKRHKSGVALRFPRIHRIRWDKPANEADQLDTLKGFIYTLT